MYFYISDARCIFAFSIRSMRCSRSHGNRQKLSDLLHITAHSGSELSTTASHVRGCVAPHSIQPTNHSRPHGGFSHDCSHSPPCLVLQRHFLWCVRQHRAPGRLPLRTFTSWAAPCCTRAPPYSISQPITVCHVEACFRMAASFSFPQALCCRGICRGAERRGAPWASATFLDVQIVGGAGAPCGRRRRDGRRGKGRRSLSPRCRPTSTPSLAKACTVWSHAMEGQSQNLTLLATACASYFNAMERVIE